MENKTKLGQSFFSSLLSFVNVGSFLGYWIVSFISTTENYFSSYETIRTYLSLYPIFSIVGIIIGIYLKSNNENKRPGTLLMKISIGVLICTVLVYLVLFFFPSEYNSWK